MSFKRDGDDMCMLRNLQHRRVADLISNHIPDEEAKLLSNGRLTCLVCSRRPIFDTISILSVHRRGKKHLIELSKYLRAKRELEQQKEKNDHEIMVRTGSLPPSETALGKGFLSACTSPYLSCAKRSNKDKGQHRRITLGVGYGDDAASYLPDLTQGKESGPSASSDVRKYLKGIKKKKDLKRSIEECRLNYSLQPTTSRPKMTSPSLPQQPSLPSEASDSTPLPQALTVAEEAVKKQAENDTKYKMSGWLKDLDGNWIKDPNAEFDSDEEEPDCQ